MDIQAVLALLKDQETHELLRSLLLAEQQPAPPPPAPVYLWCAKMTTVDGVNWYHPMVTQAKMSMRVEDLQNPDNYTMLFDSDQFKAHDNYKYMADMAARATGKEMRLIAVPAATFNSLQNKLTELMKKVLSEIERCMDPIDRVSELTHTDASVTKAQLYMTVLSQMDTLWDCIGEDMSVATAEDHEYISNRHDYDYDDEDEYDYDDDEDDYEYDY